MHVSAGLSIPRLGHLPRHQSRTRPSPSPGGTPWTLPVTIFTLAGSHPRKAYGNELERVAQRQLSRAAGTLVALHGDGSWGQPGSHSVLEGWSQEEMTYPGGLPGR